MLRDIKNDMNNKRPNCAVSSHPSLLDATKGLSYLIPYSGEFTIGRNPACSVVIENTYISRHHCIITFINNQFIVYDNDTRVGTYINCKKILSGKSNFVTLEHGDLISFGNEINMQFIFKFVFPSYTAKRVIMDNECAATEVPILNEKLKNCVKELHSEILNLKVDKLIFSNIVKTQVSEFQKMIQDSTKKISEYQNMLMLNQECSIESFKTEVTALLEDYFQCPICNEVLIKASMGYCHHAFCEICISQWLQKSKNCPVCRTSLQKTTRCITIDNFITNLFELIGGKAKEQRDILQKEMLVQESTTNRGRKRKLIRKTPHQITRSNVSIGTETIDLTHTPSL